MFQETSLFDGKPATPVFRVEGALGGDRVIHAAGRVGLRHLVELRMVAVAARIVGVPALSGRSRKRGLAK